MNDDVRYEIYIGCKDQQTKKEVVDIDILIETVKDYFAKKEMDYSLQQVEGGYLHSDGVFTLEKTLCIIIIGNQDLDVFRFAKGLSMFMNQECFMITKNNLLVDYR